MGEALPVLEQELSGEAGDLGPATAAGEEGALAGVSYCPSLGCFDGNLFICFAGSPVILCSALPCLPPSLPRPPLPFSFNDQISQLRAELERI